MMRSHSMMASIVTTMVTMIVAVLTAQAREQPLANAYPVAIASMAPSATLRARFIGNMALAIDDGTTTLVTDFPYQSGYSIYMAYPADQIRSDTSRTLALITHRHAHHWERTLFDKTDWQVAGPADVVRSVPPTRVVALTPRATFGALQIQAIETPHADVEHYSYVVTWHGKRLYFSGDTKSSAHLTGIEQLDVTSIPPWLYRSAIKRGVTIEARRIVTYHHASGEQVPECLSNCVVPRQGDIIEIP